MRARSLFVLGALLILVPGCGGHKFARVSGKVMLNNKPLANATVSFQPIAPEGSSQAGPGSQAKTNENGEFTLEVSTGQTGAVVGKHRVSISCLDPKVGDSDARPPRGGWPMADRVPKRYNAETELTFDVPPGGTDAADFTLTAP
jgi:hypothetical protein